MTGAYTTEEVLKEIAERDKKDPREKEYRLLSSQYHFAETSEDKKIAKSKFEKFKKENADLIDKIHTRKWTEG